MESRKNGTDEPIYREELKMQTWYGLVDTAGGGEGGTNGGNSIDIHTLCACSVTRSCLTLQCHGLKPARPLCHVIFLARILEWFAISYSRGSSQHRG